jgi:hypothetical protein
MIADMISKISARSALKIVQGALCAPSSETVCRAHPTKLELQLSEIRRKGGLLWRRPIGGEPWES